MNSPIIDFMVLNETAWIFVRFSGLHISFRQLLLALKNLFPL